LVSYKKIIPLVFVIFFLVNSIYSTPTLANQGSAEAQISSARNLIKDCYFSVKEAEATGANISALMFTLNEAGILLSQAEMAYSAKEYNSAENYARQSKNKLNDFIFQATTLTQTASSIASLDFITMALSLIASIGIMCFGISVWLILKRKEKISSNGYQQYSAFLLVITAILALFVASPVLENLEVAPQTEYFTEFSVLGSYHNATYPFNIRLGEKYALYLNVANHIGTCSYYNIDMKFGNQTQAHPDSFAKTASDQPALGRLSIFVADKESLELPVEVSFDYQLDENSKLYMKQVYLNGIPLTVDTIIEWDSQREGFFGNLFFELWIFDDELEKFNYHQRHLSLSLKFNL
jgi:hypothetical protein